MTKADELERLKKLYDDGTLSMQEFEQMKREVIETGPQKPLGSASDFLGLSGEMTPEKENQWNMFMHLSQLLNFIPLAGIIVPVVMWRMKCSESASVDANGKNVVNWNISLLIYMLIAMVLTLIVVGIFLMFALMIANVIFIIMGAVKAYEGEAWGYPLSIRFFK